MEEIKLSLDDLRLTPEARANIERSKRGSRKVSASKVPFIAGPIPKWWITTAASLPGKSLHVALALWFVHRCTRGQVVRMSSSLLAEFHITPDSARRALEHSELAGLVVAHRHRGRLTAVRLLLEQPNPNPEGAEACPTTPDSIPN